jgi:hypothetical protein
VEDAAQYVLESVCVLLLNVYVRMVRLVLRCERAWKPAAMVVTMCSVAIVESAGIVEAGSRSRNVGRQQERKPVCGRGSHRFS